VALSGSPGVGCHADASPHACQFLGVLRELTCQTVAVRDLFKTPEERGARGTGGGVYLLLAACPACSELDAVRDVPMLSVADLADLARSPLDSPGGGQEPDPDQVPVEFFDDPEHALDCPLR
jgi:hypothetical protein